jgi:hypothetical protein
MRRYRVLGGILLLALVLRVVFYHGYTASDDGSYHTDADRMLAGTYRVTDPQLDLKGYRFGLLLPLAALKAFLPAFLASAVLTIGAALGSIVLVYRLGRRFRSERAGLVAAGLLAVAPLGIQMSTSLFPEVLVTFTLLLAFECFLQARPGWAALAGLLAGVALLQKENAFYWFPFFAWWAWKGRVPFRTWAWGAATLLAVGVLLLVFYGVAAGDPFYQVRRIDRQYGHHLVTDYYPTSGAILRRLTVELLLLLFSPVEVSTAAYGFLFYLVLPAAWMLRRDPAARPFLVLAAVLLVLLNFFPARFFPFLPNALLYRYLYPALIPVVLLLGQAADLRPRWGARVGVPLFAFHLVCAWAIHADARAANSNLPELGGRLRSAPRAVWSDSRTVPAMRYYFGRSVDARVLGESRPAPGDWVLMNYQYLQRHGAWYSNPIPEVFRRVEPGWTPIAEVVPRYRRSLRRGGLGWRPAPEDRAVLYRVE